MMLGTDESVRIGCFLANVKIFWNFILFATSFKETFNLLTLHSQQRSVVCV